jgi:uncharacterized protein
MGSSERGIEFREEGVSFEEAEGVFLGPRSKTVYDDRHSTAEDRYVILGRSEQGSLLVVSHTDRGERVRIISARRADRAERMSYEEDA